MSKKVFKKAIFSSLILTVVTNSTLFAKNKNSNATLSQSLPEVVVTATRTAIPTVDSPSQVEVVTRKDIELKRPFTLDEAVEDLPGVLVKRSKGLMDTLASITLRGIPDQKRTLIMIDGIILNSPYYGGVKLGGFFPEDIKRVEVVEGPSSSLYGSYAMGGVVNFITEMPKKREFTLKAGYGSSFKRGTAMDDLRRFFVSFGDRVKKFSIFMSYGREDTNGYPTSLVIKSSPPAGTIGAEPTVYDSSWAGVSQGYIIGDKGDNTYWDDGILFKTQYEFSNFNKLRLTFIRSRYKYNYDKPHTYLLNATTLQPVYAPSEYDYIAWGGYGGRTEDIVGINWIKRLNSKVNMKTTLSYLTTEKDWYVLPKYGATFSGGPGKISSTDQYRYYGDIQFTFPIFTSHLLTVGGSFIQDYARVKEENLSNWKDETSTTGLTFECKGRERTYALFLQDEWLLSPKWIVYSGVRADFWKAYDGYVNDVGQTGYPKSYPSHTKTSLSPKFAVVYKANDRIKLRASIGKAFRAPTIYELYRTWVYWGTTYEGNPYLNPETVWSWDVGINSKLWKGADLGVTYFHNLMKDLIYRKTVGSVKKYVNVGKAVSKGVEAEFNQKLGFGIKFFANLTYTDSEIKENDADPQSVGKRLTYTPLWMWNVGLKFNHQKFSGYVLGHYVGKMYANDLNEDTASDVYGSYDKHFTVDARLNYSFNKHATLSFEVDNIFNEKYYQYYKAPERQWYTELTLKF